MPGNSFLRFLAGPGILCLNCEHAAYISDGVFKNRELPPGLNFTDLFDQEPRVVDLRPQLRAFPVEALTKDGIPLKVTTFIPFRIDAGDQVVEPGGAFPFRPGAIHAVIRSELAARTADKQAKDSGKKHAWDGGPKEDGLIPMRGTRIMQDIINRYQVDELCNDPTNPQQDPQDEIAADFRNEEDNLSPMQGAWIRQDIINRRQVDELPNAPTDPERDPRGEIVAELRNRVDELLPPLGLVRAGGGISNLIPQSDIVVKRRLDSWRTRWEQEILRLIGHGKARATFSIQKGQAEAEAGAASILDQAIRDSGVPMNALALRFIDALGEIVSESNQWPLPAEVEAIWQRLCGEIEETQKPAGS